MVRSKLITTKGDGTATSDLSQEKLLTTTKSTSIEGTAELTATAIPATMILTDDCQSGENDEIDSELPPGITSSDLDAMLANELRQLSTQERKEIQYDMHGVGDIVEERQAFVDEQLKQLEAAIACTTKKAAYDQASRQCPEYINDRKLRLMFLRAERFHAKRAARKMVKFFDEKLALFGPGMLTVQLGDLTELDKEMLELGFLQILPFRDRAKRTIFCGVPALMSEKYCRASTRREKDRINESVSRAVWYLIMASLEDEETQRKGTVVIGCNFGLSRVKFLPGFVTSVLRVRRTLPERIACVHYLFDDSRFRRFLSIAMYVGGKELRSRFRCHFGTHLDYQCELSRFGIPAELLPINHEGKCELGDHREWLRSRQKKEMPPEKNRYDEEGPIVPRRFDVLLGRGPGIFRHTGNHRLGHIVNMYREQYEKANKFQKTVIAERIVRIIHESEGRFLKQENGGWAEVEDGIARNKISHSFRTLRNGDVREPQEQSRHQVSKEAIKSYKKTHSN